MAYSGSLTASGRKFATGPAMSASRTPFWNNLLTSLRRVNECRRQRQAEAGLRAMSERQLRDIGLDPRRISFMAPGVSPEAIPEAINESAERRAPSSIKTGEYHVA